MTEIQLHQRSSSPNVGEAKKDLRKRLKRFQCMKGRMVIFKIPLKVESTFEGRPLKADKSTFKGRQPFKRIFKRTFEGAFEGLFSKTYSWIITHPSKMCAQWLPLQTTAHSNMIPGLHRNVNSLEINFNLHISHCCSKKELWRFSSPVRVDCDCDLGSWNLGRPLGK